MAVPTFNIPSESQNSLNKIVEERNSTPQKETTRTKNDFFSDVQKMIDTGNFADQNEAILETAKYANSKGVQYEGINYDDLFQSVAKPVETEVVEEEKENISGLDIGVNAGKGISGFGKDVKIGGFELGEDTKVEGATKTLANIPGDAIEAVGETIELVSDPIGTVKSLVDLGQGLSDKLVFGTLNKVFGKEVEATEKSKIVDAVTEDLKENFGTKEQAIETITNNPVDSVLFIKGIIKSAKKVAGKETVKDLESFERTIPEKLNDEAIKQVEQALGTSKEKFKQKGRELAPGIIDRGITGSKQEIQELAQSKAADYSSQIKEYVDSGKLTGTVKRDDLLDVLDNIRKEGQVGDVIVDESIVKATDTFAAIVSGFGKEISAEKARNIRQIFDEAVYNTKGVVSEEALSLKNNIKKGLADEIRKQLADQNPDLAVINKEFNFYNKLDEVLTETLNRQGPQQGGLTSNLLAGGGLGAGGAIFGDITGAIATAAVVKGLSEAMRSTKWKTVSAKYKSQLANALSKGDKVQSESIAKKIIKEALGKKAELYIGGQITESNLDDNE